MPSTASTSRNRFATFPDTPTARRNQSRLLRETTPSTPDQFVIASTTPLQVETVPETFAVADTKPAPAADTKPAKKTVTIAAVAPNTVQGLSKLKHYEQQIPTIDLHLGTNHKQEDLDDVHKFL